MNEYKEDTILNEYKEDTILNEYRGDIIIFGLSIGILITMFIVTGIYIFKDSGDRKSVV